MDQVSGRYVRNRSLGQAVDKIAIAILASVKIGSIFRTAGRAERHGVIILLPGQ